MSKIIQLTAENVKRLHAVNITPDGALVVIGGNNAQGKSSVLDSIAMALGGKDAAPGMPVRKGEEEAQIVVKLDNGITVKRRFTSAGGTSLQVLSDEGAKFPSPQAMLDGLTGKLTFDPLAFLRLDAKKQAETLRVLVGLDFSKLDQERAKLYTERTLVNRETDSLRAQVTAMPKHEGMPAEEQDVSALNKQLEEVVSQNSSAEKSRFTAENAENDIAFYEKQIVSSQNAVEFAKASLAKAEEQLSNMIKAKSDARAKHAELVKQIVKPVDTAPIKAQIESAHNVNQKVRANKARAAEVTKGQAKRDQSETLTKQIEALDAQKARMLKEAKFPVDGLSFENEVVTYNGIPLDQASSAEQQRVSVAIGAALNPKLRVMLVRDASLLDEVNLKALSETAQALDLQIWAERVGKGSECSVIIEDGSIAK